MASVLLAAFLVVLAIGCGRTDFNRGAMRGKVTLDGQPVERGSILFLSTGGEKRTASSTDITNGEYQIPLAIGPAVGNNRVEIRAMRKTGRKVAKHVGGSNEMVDEQVEAVAARFNLQSTLEYDVQPGNNTADFQVTSQAR
jgi:hypothetical protein